MSKEELSFEELPDGSKIITIQSINQFGEKYIRQERIKCPSVWDALKRLTYTAEDMKHCIHWISENFFSKYGVWVSYTDTGKYPYLHNEDELLKLWEDSKNG